MHVNQGVFEIFVTEQNLNGAEIDASLVEMRGKTVTQCVWMNAFLEAGALGRFSACNAKRSSYRSADRDGSCWETARCWTCGGSNARGRGVRRAAWD